LPPRRAMSRAARIVALHFMLATLAWPVGAEQGAPAEQAEAWSTLVLVGKPY